MKILCLFGKLSLKSYKEEIFELFSEGAQPPRSSIQGWLEPPSPHVVGAYDYHHVWCSSDFDIWRCWLAVLSTFCSSIQPGEDSSRNEQIQGSAINRTISFFPTLKILNSRSNNHVGFKPRRHLASVQKRQFRDRPLVELMQHFVSLWFDAKCNVYKCNVYWA